MSDSQWNVANLRMCANGEIANVHQVLHYSLILLAFGALTGVTTVLFGFGGGFVTVPVVYAASTLRPVPQSHSGSQDGYGRSTSDL